MPKHVSANDIIRKRVQKWEDEDPSSLVTKRIEKATAPLQWLVELLLPELLIKEAVEKTLWVAETLTEREQVLKAMQISSVEQAFECKIDKCDVAADSVHNWAIGSAAALGAWDLAGPLGVAPAVASLFTLAFRTIKKIGLCYGFDTSSPIEEMIALEVFVAGTTLYHRDKVQALKDIQRYREQGGATPEQVMETIGKLARPISVNLTKRRTLASVPAMGVLVGSSTNAWLLKDLGWAARNIYSMRRLEMVRAKLDEKKSAKAAAAAAADADSLPKAA